MVQPRRRVATPGWAISASICLPARIRANACPSRQKDDSSPASFEKALSALAAKITATQARLDHTRAKSRRVKVLCTLYLGFAYLVYGIVLVLVVGWRNMGPIEWTGLAGGPVLISLVRAVTTAFFDYRIEKLSARLRDHQTERAKTIQKLKEATKYDSTLELLEKYGGSENKQRRARKTADDDDGTDRDSRGWPREKHGRQPRRTNLPPPPTANIQRPPAPGAGAGAGTPPPGFAPPPHPDMMETSAEFAPNAFDGRQPPPPPPLPPYAMQHHQQHYPPAAAAPAASTHWYDRILDALLGEDETAAKNRIVLICGRCRLVNGQAPPGTKSLAELGVWKCMNCGAANGEMDEGSRIVREVLSGAAASEPTDEVASRSSSDLVEVDRERDVPSEAGPEGDQRPAAGEGGSAAGR